MQHARDLDDWGGRLEALDSICFFLENGRWLAWDAVVREEQGLALSDAHEEALDELLSFGDEDDRILYINDWARPREPWYEVCRRVAPTLLMPGYRTAATAYEGALQAGEHLVTRVRELAGELELPEGAASALDVIGADTWHGLIVQAAFEPLDGVGASCGDEVLHIEDEIQIVDRFIEELRERVQSVDALGLTLEALLENLILPDAERVTLVREMCARLELPDSSVPLAPHLR